ncbi:MAG: type III-B CRISPR-associated protein Cas10/Cmr2, partial [Campylobacteraceae bacterium]|nr:type III-B CRISPR-associated protein Cas10/Cmr2 [Campylobacteraceae bacterium]
MKYLVVFSITPVQAFIARARKLRDFYAGSKILSYLASVGFNAIKGEKLYPSADSNSMPNKFVFSIDAEDTKQVKSEMGRIEEVIKNAWLELADITGVSKNCVDDYWNYSWAAVPYKKNYKEAHSKVQKLLAAMKLKPHKIRKSQAGEKCHLCGENSVWKEFDADKKDKREKLCGVCTIKRDLPDLKTSIPKNHQLLNLLSKPEYSSTTKISAHKFIKKYNLDKDEIAKLNDTNSDGRGNSLPNKERYYALLAMDGDKMGDLVNTKITSEEHLELSKKLDSFDRKVENLSCFKGTAKLIYAGGDDVFAILPLEEAIAIAKEIRELYTDIVAKEEKTTSISAAIVIAHHKEPLREVIRDTHEVLDTIAKEKAGRDALAIRLKKRGGGDRDLFFK